VHEGVSGSDSALIFLPISGFSAGVPHGGKYSENLPFQIARATSKAYPSARSVDN